MFLTYCLINRIIVINYNEHPDVLQIREKGKNFTCGGFSASQFKRHV